MLVPRRRGTVVRPDRHRIRTYLVCISFRIEVCWFASGIDDVTVSISVYIHYTVRYPVFRVERREGLAFDSVRESASNDSNMTYINIISQPDTSSIVAGRQRNGTANRTGRGGRAIGNRPGRTGRRDLPRVRRCDGPERGGPRESTGTTSVSSSKQPATLTRLAVDDPHRDDGRRDRPSNAITPRE